MNSFCQLTWIGAGVGPKAFGAVGRELLGQSRGMTKVTIKKHPHATSKCRRRVCTCVAIPPMPFAAWWFVCLGSSGRSRRCHRQVRLRRPLRHLIAFFRVIPRLASVYKVFRVRGRGLSRPGLGPGSREALFERNGLCHLSRGMMGKGSTYATRAAIAVVGCTGVSNAIARVYRWCGRK